MMDARNKAFGDTLLPANAGEGTELGRVGAAVGGAVRRAQQD